MKLNDFFNQCNFIYFYLHLSLKRERGKTYSGQKQGWARIIKWGKIIFLRKFGDNFLILSKLG